MTRLCLAIGLALCTGCTSPSGTTGPDIGAAIRITPGGIQIVPTVSAGIGTARISATPGGAAVSAGAGPVTLSAGL